MHPLAITDHSNGARGMKAGDRVLYTIDTTAQVLPMSFCNDGNALMTWDDENLRNCTLESSCPGSIIGMVAMLTPVHLEMFRRAREYAIEEAIKAQEKARTASQRALDATQIAANFDDLLEMWLNSGQQTGTDDDKVANIRVR